MDAEPQKPSRVRIERAIAEEQQEHEQRAAHSAPVFAGDLGLDEPFFESVSIPRAVSRIEISAHPFMVSGSGASGTILKGLLFDGVNWHVPQIGGGDMDDIQSISLSSGGVWLHVEWAPNVVDDEVHSGGTPVTVELVTTPGTGELPTNTTNGHVYIHLWEQGSTFPIQWTKSNIRLQYCAATGFVPGTYGS
ncbi:hypothetical protein [Verrucomicrobium sp. BvORR106]|uniref:hypothetical protein n=1 Tax=Verrucomicrobium sp. BvORR106 TaxID=1403819 RepID=UPI0005712383|nr:hypothetical protein [Verrucomicrobium sp. BvORR106]